VRARLLSSVWGPLSLPAYELDARRARLIPAPTEVRRRGSPPLDAVELAGERDAAARLDRWALSERIGAAGAGLWRDRGRAASEAAALAFLVEGPHELFEAASTKLFEAASTKAGNSPSSCRVDDCGRDAASSGHGFCDAHLGRIAGAWLRLWHSASSMEELEALWSKLADELAFQEGGVG
jgi:hypothetical protein